MININRLYNSKLYQLLKFFHNGKIPREIIFVFANCNQMSADYVSQNVEFCNNFLDYLPEEKGEYLETRITFYKYYESSHS